MTVVTIRQTHDLRSFLDRKSSLPALVVAPGTMQSNFLIQHMHCPSSAQTLLQFVTNFDVGKQTHCDLRRASFVSPTASSIAVTQRWSTAGAAGA